MQPGKQTADAIDAKIFSLHGCVRSWSTLWLVAPRAGSIGVKPFARDVALRDIEHVTARDVALRDTATDLFICRYA